MGNRMCGGIRRPVEERLTRPQRLLRQPSDVDYRKLRKLILAQKLAPCFDALDNPHIADLEECPICFFYYPSLNRSRCCTKGICTECFLQMKPSDTTRPAQCPFCKSSSYAVEYRGARTEEEKGLEQAEEQKVIEAKIRMQCESQFEDRVMRLDQPRSLLEVLRTSSIVGGPSSGEGRDIAELVCSEVRENIEVDGSSDPDTYSTRHEELNVYLEEIMVMEGIWQSLQDSILQKSKNSKTCELSEIGSGIHGTNTSGASFPPCDQEECSSSHFAVPISRLAEHNMQLQQLCEPDCETSQTNKDPCENFVQGSNRTQSETG